MASLNALLRIAMVVLLAVCLAGCHIFRPGDVEYAPGYGYVVPVDRWVRDQEFIGKLKLMGRYYYVFETEDAAKEFIAELEADSASSAGKRHRPRYEEGSEDYDKIQCALGLKVCLAPGVVKRAIDPVTSPVPIAPLPQ